MPVINSGMDMDDMWHLIYRSCQSMSDEKKHVPGEY